MNNRGLAYLALCFAALVPTDANAQTFVEYSLGVARAAGLGSAMKNVGKSMTSVLDSVNGKLSQSAKALTNSADPHGRTVTSTSVRESVLPVSVCAEDPGRVLVSLKYDEVIRRCGTPALETTASQSNLTLLYTAKDTEVVVDIIDGAVAAVSPKQKRQSVSVIMLR